MIETSVFQIFHGGNLTFVNLFDKTEFSTFLLAYTITGKASGLHCVLEM